MRKPNDLLTAGEAAAARGVNIKSVYRAIEGDRLKAERRGKTILIKWKDLQAWRAIPGRSPKEETNDEQDG